MNQSDQKREQLKPPITNEQLKALFDYLNNLLEKQGCDDTSRFAIAWLENNGHPTQDVIDWLEENGGYCDCEVVMNVLYEMFEDEYDEDEEDEDDEGEKERAKQKRRYMRSKTQTYCT